MTKAEEKKINEAVEAAFRRGFSHGFVIGRDPERAWVTIDEVLRWRHCRNKGRVIAPGHYRQGEGPKYY